MSKKQKPAYIIFGKAACRNARQSITVHCGVPQRAMYVMQCTAKCFGPLTPIHTMWRGAQARHHAGVHRAPHSFHGPLLGTANKLMHIFRALTSHFGVHFYERLACRISGCDYQWLRRTFLACFVNMCKVWTKTSFSPRPGVSKLF